jgi:hypothetical protein
MLNLIKQKTKSQKKVVAYERLKQTGKKKKVKYISFTSRISEILSGKSALHFWQLSLLKEKKSCESNHLKENKRKKKNGF